MTPRLRRRAADDAVDDRHEQLTAWCPEIELSTGEVTSRVPASAAHRSVRALVRGRGEVLGFVTVLAPPASVTPERLRDAAVSQFANELTGSGPTETVDPTVIDGEPLVTVAVCTRNRSAMLSRCLDALLLTTYAHIEIVVVDNAPGDASTAEVVASYTRRDARVRYECEPRPGLSCARNRAIAAARGEFVAYTDDDVWVDPAWVSRIVRAFRSQPNIGCVTGAVCAASLTTPSELFFDARISAWSSRWHARTFDLAAHAVDDPLYPYTAGIFGTGANFAFRRDLLVDLGGFDEALGAGTLTHGGEDLDIFVRTLQHGSAIRYEPNALVWHYHRSEAGDLRAQMYGYGSGLTAYLTKTMLRPSARRDLVSRVPDCVRRMRRLRGEARVDGDRADARPALSAELRGYLAGPVLYARSRRRLARTGPPAAVHGERAAGTAGST